MLHFILQVVFFQLSFLLVYELLLKKETFFTYNRWYLLLTPIIALLLPLIRFEGLSSLVPAESLVLLPEVVLGTASGATKDAEAVAAGQAGWQINWWWLFYSVGAALSLLLFFRKVAHLRQLFRGRLLSEDHRVRIIQVAGTKIACTFYNTVFLGDELSEGEKQQILSHELVHVRQKHSLDLVFFELLKILFWFNPLIYVFQSKLAGVHEFIADSQVIKSTEKKTYYQQLLNTAFSTENISFINQFFNHSLIKKRIVMLQKSKSKSAAKLKYLIMLPLLLIMLTYVACSEDPVKIENVSSQPEEIEDLKMTLENMESLSAADKEKILEILSSKSYDATTSVKQVEAEGEIMDVPFAVIEEVPVYPGCEGLASNEAKKECMSEKITAHISKNFDSGLGKELGLKGVNKIYVQFRIEKDGGITVLGARAPHPALQEEAERVVNSLPQMSPGKQDGQKVGVLYSLPIVFDAGE